MNYSDIKSEYRLQADTGDKWGCAMSAHFDVAEELYRRDADIPSSWQFSPGAMGVGEPDSYLGIILMAADTADLLRFGLVLSRYIDLLKRADLDY